MRNGHTCCADQHVVEEARRNLIVQRQGAVHKLDVLLSAVAVLPYISPIPEFVKQLQLPQSDKHVVAGAVSAKCTHLVTGYTKHFKKYFDTTVNGVMIVTPAKLAELL